MRPSDMTGSEEGPDVKGEGEEEEGNEDGDGTTGAPFKVVQVVR